jgi:hypothetical protein
MQRQRDEMGLLAAFPAPETALIREFGRHVFDITTVLRAPNNRYNFRVWVVGATGIEPIFGRECHPADLPKTALYLQGFSRYTFDIAYFYQMNRPPNLPPPRTTMDRRRPP